MCKHDACCMAFEWLDDECTLKSRSLNGTVETKPGAFFGLCIDYGAYLCQFVLRLNALWPVN